MPAATVPPLPGFQAFSSFVPVAGVCLASACGPIFMSLSGNVCESVTILNAMNTKMSKTQCVSSGSCRPGRRGLEAPGPTRWMRSAREIRDGGPCCRAFGDSLTDGHLSLKGWVGAGCT